MLRIDGESMEPRFRPGDFVVVRRPDTTAATFKQLIEEDGGRYLKALNPDWPEPIVHADDDAAVCGVAVFQGSIL